MVSLYDSIVRAELCLPKWAKRMPFMKVYAIYLVMNEDDVISQTVTYKIL